MKKIKMILWLVIVVILTIISTTLIDKNYSTSVWMSDIVDSTNIKEMAIPGTHDSGANHSIFDVAGKCQDMKIETQLKIGVRFFDLRLQLVDDEFKIVHSFVDQNLKFKKVLDDLTSFIRKYDSEFLIISLKQEESSVNSNSTFEEAIMAELSKYDEITYDNLPNTLGEARGKIYVLSRCNIDVGINAYYGWADSQTFELNELYIQDNYCINDIEVKKDDIIKTLEYSKTNKTKLILNFTSCYLDNAFPPSYAGSTAKEINPWLIDYINKQDNISGIIICDFITKNLAESIYKRNLL